MVLAELFQQDLIKELQKEEADYKRQGTLADSKLKRDQMARAKSALKAVKELEAYREAENTDNNNTPEYSVKEVLFDIRSREFQFKEKGGLMIDEDLGSYYFVDKARLELPTINITDANTTIMINAIPSQHGSTDGFLLGDATKYSSKKKNEGECLAIGWISDNEFIVTAGGKSYTSIFPIPRVPISMMVTILNNQNIDVTFSIAGARNNVSMQRAWSNKAKKLEINRVGVAGGKYYEGGISECAVYSLIKNK
jgi:hypothetical protein